MQDILKRKREIQAGTQREYNRTTTKKDRKNFTTPQLFNCINIDLQSTTPTAQSTNSINQSTNALFTNHNAP